MRMNEELEVAKESSPPTTAGLRGIKLVRIPLSDENSAHRVFREIGEAWSKTACVLQGK